LVTRTCVFFGSFALFALRTLTLTLRCRRLLLFFATCSLARFCATHASRFFCLEGPADFLRWCFPAAPLSLPRDVAVLRFSRCRFLASLVASMIWFLLLFLLQRPPLGRRLELEPPLVFISSWGPQHPCQILVVPIPQKKEVLPGNSADLWIQWHGCCCL
jgi:hypothetical protein